MASVVLLKGVNVGGHRRVKPTTVARRLAHLDVVSIGAAGTFVVRRPVGRADLRAAFARVLPFDAHLAICDGREILRLLSRDVFGQLAVDRDVIRFVSVLTGRPPSPPSPPFDLPACGEWMVRVLAREGRFVIALHRRRMRAIRQLAALDCLFGVPVTTRSWSTLVAIADVLRRGTT